LTHILDAAKRGVLTREQADALHALGAEAVALFALAMAEHVARLQPGAALPSTPSGQVPVYEKPTTDKRRRKKPGAKDGHKGSRRKTPQKIDARVEHRLEVCPCCGGELQRCKRQRTRIIEDIPQEITPVVTEHTIHRDYCPSCKKHVEPVVSDAMPNATLGHNLIALSSWFHYGLGITIGQVRDILGSHLHTDITAGGLLDGWQRLAQALFPWYEQIASEARSGAVLHADETGWRVDASGSSGTGVFLQSSQLLLPDRQKPRNRGVAQVLHRGFQWHVGDRLLGRLRLGLGRRQSEMPAPSAARTAQGG